MDVRALVRLRSLEGRRAQGSVTRGKTAPRRHRAIDIYMVEKFTSRFRAGGVVVDHGFGAVPVTTYELRALMDRRGLGAHIMAVEIVPERVAMGRDTEGISFRLGGFNLPRRPGERIRLIKSLNVLRQYGEDEYLPAMARLALYLEECGIIVEGTSNPSGSMAVLNVFVKKGTNLHWTETVFIDRKGGTDPLAFRAVLPKNLIHRAGPGTEMDAVLTRWHLEFLKYGHNTTEIRKALVDGAIPVLSSKRDCARGWWRLAPRAFASQTVHSIIDVLK